MWVKENEITDMKIFITLCFLVFTSVTHAEIYKCVVNDSTIFSDAPCAEESEAVELKLHRPKAEDIEKQNETTARYQQDSKVNEIEALKQKNEGLKTQIQQLQQQADKELQVLKDKTYRYSDTQIAATERGVFNKMNEVINHYQAQIQRVRSEISTNEMQIEAIKHSLRAYQN